MQMPRCLVQGVVQYLKRKLNKKEEERNKGNLQNYITFGILTHFERSTTLLVPEGSSKKKGYAGQNVCILEVSKSGIGYFPNSDLGNFPKYVHMYLSFFRCYRFPMLYPFSSIRGLNCLHMKDIKNYSISTLY